MSWACADQAEPMRNRLLNRDKLLPNIWRVLPVLFFLWLYHDSFQIWFREDDFQLLAMTKHVRDAHDFLNMLFSPYAQGTIRPWSERLPFFLSTTLFGTDCVAFRVLVFVTAVADMWLLSLIAQRLIGSRIAAVAAACVWAAGASVVSPMTWNSSYNEVQFPLFVLAALLLFVRYQETGKKRFWWYQFLVFVAGFGSLENNIVYPAIAAAWAVFVSPAANRKRLIASTLPLFAISLLFFIVHVKVAPLPSDGLYSPHLDFRIFRTFWEYWRWAFVSPGWIQHRHSSKWGNRILFVTMASILAFVGWRTWKRKLSVLFCLAWFLLTLAPMLPLPDRHSEYYLAVPTMGLAMIAGWGLATAWKSGWNHFALALIPAVAWFSGMIPVVRAEAEHWVAESDMSIALLLGVSAIRQKQPDKAILLDGITDQLYRIAIWEGGLSALRIENVYLTPSAAAGLHQLPGDEMLRSMTVDPAVAFHALDADQAVVYSFAGNSLRNITRVYLLHRILFNNALPQRVEIGNPLYAYMLGSGWSWAQNGARSMSGEASIRISGPDSPGHFLLVEGYCTEKHLASGPAKLSVAANHIPLGESAVSAAETHFRRSFAVPAVLIGAREMEVSLMFRPKVHSAGHESVALFGNVALESHAGRYPLE